MANYGPGTCIICGQRFTRRSNNSVCCSHECRKIRDKRRWIAAELNGPPKISKCQVCGKEFVGRNSYKIYLACNNPECRAETRRLAGIKSSERQAKRKRERGTMRICLKCGHEFLSAHKFNRICSDCHNNLDANPIGATWWGAVI